MTVSENRRELWEMIQKSDPVFAVFLLEFKAYLGKPVCMEYQKKQIKVKPDT